MHLDHSERRTFGRQVGRTQTHTSASAQWQSGSRPHVLVQQSPPFVSSLQRCVQHCTAVEPRWYVRVTTLVAVRTSKRSLGRSGWRNTEETLTSTLRAQMAQRHRDGLQTNQKLEGKLTRKFKNDEVEVDPMESHRILRVSYSRLSCKFTGMHYYGCSRTFKE